MIVPLLHPHEFEIGDAVPKGYAHLPQYPPWYFVKSVKNSRLHLCGGINPYTLTARIGPGGLAHYETSSRFDLTARSFAQGNKTWRSSRILVG